MTRTASPATSAGACTASLTVASTRSPAGATATTTTPERAADAATCASSAASAASASCARASGASHGSTYTANTGSCADHASALPTAISAVPSRNAPNSRAASRPASTAPG